MKKIKGIIFCTSTMTVEYFLEQHIKRLAKKYKIFIVSDFEARKIDQSKLLENGVELVHLSISRQMNVFSDLCALINLLIILTRIRPNFIHTVTPKAGLMGMLLGFLVGIPIRTHTYTGQLWANKQGPPKFFLKLFDWVIALCSTDTTADSHSQMEFLVNERVVPRGKISVIGFGSISGVDLNRFRPNLNARLKLRNKIGADENSTIILFIGRIARDKGVLDLAEAYAQITKLFDDIFLVIVGPDEDGLIDEIKKIIGARDRGLRIYPQTSAPESYYILADVIALPSYREGFGTVLIEAAACGLPAVASNIYGISDAVIDNETGFLHKPKDINSIISKLSKFLHNKELILKMGTSARERAARLFSKEVVVDNFIYYYDQIINNWKCDVKKKQKNI